MTHKVRYRQRPGGLGTLAVLGHLQVGQLNIHRMCASSLAQPITVQSTSQCDSNRLSRCLVSAIAKTPRQGSSMLFIFFSLLGTYPPNTWVLLFSLISQFSLISLNKVCFCFACSQEYLCLYHWHEQMNSGATVPDQSLVTECLAPQVLGLSTAEPRAVLLC